MAETITLSGVPETMLQTVYARAKESRGRGAIRDLKAEEIIGRLDYDFSLADKDAAMHSGVIARTIVLDRLVGEYLAAHPGATVMNLACGLDTRCYRMQGYAHWYNLDLPETIAVREALLPESGSISQLAMSAMDDWGAAVEGPSGPALVIIEGLTMYLTQAAALNAAFDARLQALRADNAAAGKEKQFHLENQILPGIAAYETLQTVMPKEEALQTVHGYVEQRAWKLRKLFLALMRVPGLPRKTPGIFTKQTRRMFGEAAGFEAWEIETTGGVWRIDMIKCPYHDACVHYGCPELCPCFCDSDDITYNDLHPDLLWRRTRTLGRGNDCCDFCLKLR